MRTLGLENDPLAIDLAFSDSAFRVFLEDGRELSIPYAWFPRLLNGTAEQRSVWQLIGRGEGIHWPELDEDISVLGLLAGHRSQAGHRKSAA